jgi:DNA-binding protein H-NS
MSDYKTLLQKRTELDQQIEAARQSEVSIALENVRALVADYELTQEDVFGKKKSGKVGQTVAPKYRDDATGATWTGRGKPPRWLNGKNRDDYLIT